MIIGHKATRLNQPVHPHVPNNNNTGLKAAVQAQGWATEADARLQALNGKRVAVGADFNPRCVRACCWFVRVGVWVGVVYARAMGGLLAVLTTLTPAAPPPQKTQNSTGKLQDKKEASVTWLTEEGMAEVAAVLADAGTAWVVRDVESKVRCWW